MDKLKIEIIRKLFMLETMEEVRNIRENTSDAISRECDLDDKQQEEFKKWKEQNG